MSTELKKRLLRLLEEDEEFRYAVAGRLGMLEILKRLDENTAAIRDLQGQVAGLQRQMVGLQEQVVALQRQAAEHSKAVRDLQRQVADNTAAIRSLQEQVAEHSKAVRDLQEQVVALQRQVADNTAAIKQLQEQVAEHSKAIMSLQRTVTAIGARWGMLAEKAFREGMRGLVERIFGGRVRKWTVYDEEGLVHGRPSIVDVDLVVTDKEHVLVEIKSSVSRADVYELWRVARLYEKRTGVRPRLAVVSPFVDPRARETAEELEIEVYTGT